MKTRQTAPAIGFCHYNAGILENPDSIDKIQKLVELSSEFARFSNFRMVLMIEDELYHHLARWVDSCEGVVPAELQDQLQAARRQLDAILVEAGATGVTLLHAHDLIPFFEGMKEKHQEQFQGKFYDFVTGGREPLGYTGPKLIRDLIALSKSDIPVFNLDQDVIQDAENLELVALEVTQLVGTARENLDQPFAISGAYTDERVYDQSSIRVLQFMNLRDAEALPENSEENGSEPAKPIDVYSELLSAQEIRSTLKTMAEKIMPHIENQFLSGASFIPNALFLKQFPEFTNLRGLATWSDDHWLEAIRMGSLPEAAAANLDIRFDQKRHPEGAKLTDVRWHAKNYLIRLLFSIAGLEMLKNPTLLSALQNDSANTTTLTAALWDSARRSLTDLVSAEKSQYYAGTVMAAVVNGTDRARELGFLNKNLYPNGLRAAIMELPENYPAGYPEDGTLINEVKKLVEDIVVWATEMRTWWSDCFVPVAESFPFDAAPVENDSEASNPTTVPSDDE